MKRHDDPLIHDPPRITATGLRALTTHGLVGRRLSVALAVGIILSFAAFSTITLHIRHRENIEVADHQVQELADGLVAAVNALAHEHRPEDLAGVANAMGYTRSHRIQGVALYDTNLRVVVASRTLQRIVPLLSPIAREVVVAHRGVHHSMTLAGRRVIAVGILLAPDVQDTAAVGVVVRDVSWVDRSIARGLQRIALNASVVVLVVVGLVLALTRRMVTVPVGKLLVGVRRIAEGDLETPLVVDGDDEISRVGTAVDDMRRALADARAELAQDIARRVDLEAKIETERRLQHAQRLSAVGQIAAGIAHEIGSPLHVIAGRARYGASRTESPEVRENLEVIATQADRITGVVQQLLTVARKHQPRSVSVDVRGVIEKVVRLVGPQARQQGVTLQVLGDMSRKLLTEGDPDALQQVFFNLVLNALQAQPGGGMVTVSAGEGEAQDSLGVLRTRVVIDVRDHGPGIAPELSGRLFEPFATSKEDGTGLGLAVARGILRDHGGTICAVTPEDGGPGALFRVTLPLADGRRMTSDGSF